MQTLNNISIILTRPQMGENIGAAARVMLNFGITDLRIICPRDGWPNEKALAMSAGANQIINNAKIFDKFEDAIADLNIVYATTARERDMVKPAVTPKQMADEAAQASTAKIGVVFGPERTGLENIEVSFCNKILYVPVNSEYKSLNLAQAVALVCYELFQTNVNKIYKVNDVDKAELASKGDYNALFEFLEVELDRSNFFQVAEKKPRMMDNIRNIFAKTNLTKQEMQTLRGVLKAIKEV
jgi:tRNA/rRNA methyltransferase